MDDKVNSRELKFSSLWKLELVEQIRPESTSLAPVYVGSFKFYERNNVTLIIPNARTNFNYFSGVSTCRENFAREMKKINLEIRNLE